MYVNCETIMVTELREVCVVYTETIETIETITGVELNQIETIMVRSLERHNNPYNEDHNSSQNS